VLISLSVRRAKINLSPPRRGRPFNFSLSLSSSSSSVLSLSLSLSFRRQFCCNKNIVCDVCICNGFLLFFVLCVLFFTLFFLLFAHFHPQTKDHTNTHTIKERESERERERRRRGNTHKHTERERKREREKESVITMSSSAEQRQQNSTSSHQKRERRPSELQLDAKWEAAIDVTLRRVVYGCIGGTTMAFLMCRGTTARAAVSAFGAGVGVGSAYEDAAKLFK